MAVTANEKYGRLTTIEKVGIYSNRNAMWKCQCDCGNIIYVPSGSLKTNNTKSCGCLHKDSMKEMGVKLRKLNQYDLSGEFGIGFTSKGEQFLFDKEDYEIINQYTWRINDQGYALTIPFGKQIRMHVLIMNSDLTKEVDHINGIRHDNRKSNLRICEHYQNIINSKTRTDNTSGKRGVYWDKSRNKWVVIITVNNKSHHIGRYSIFEDAVKAREEAEVKYFGEYAPTER